MLAVLIRALRRFGAPDALYLDNGATYRGETLSLACVRLGTSLVHAKPYDAPARGKMERSWRTLREGCLDFTGALSSLHDVNVRLYAFLDERYHRSPHAGLMGKTPEAVFNATPRHAEGFDEKQLRDALTVHGRRRVRGDCTIPMDGGGPGDRPRLPRPPTRHRFSLHDRRDRAAVARARGKASRPPACRSTPRRHARAVAGLP